ncbi:MAG: hypothetical protein F4233_02720 [Rhodospirillaceae bacterium]|nr:hypothetical protein [Rhodospirillaceae bacterium]
MVEDISNNLHRLPFPKVNVRKQKWLEGQLELPLDIDAHAGKVIILDQLEIQPSTIENLLLCRGISCVIDLRKVPFFLGHGRRHEHIVDVLIQRDIPVFHAGVTYFEYVDQNLPTSMIIEQVLEFVRRSPHILDQVESFTQRGGCILVVDESSEVLNFAKIFIFVLMKLFHEIDVELNESWSRVARF